MNGDPNQRVRCLTCRDAGDWTGAVDGTWWAISHSRQTSCPDRYRLEDVPPVRIRKAAALSSDRPWLWVVRGVRGPAAGGGTPTWRAAMLAAQCELDAVAIEAGVGTRP